MTPSRRQLNGTCKVSPRRRTTLTFLSSMTCRERLKECHKEVREVTAGRCKELTAVSQEWLEGLKEASLEEVLEGCSLESVSRWECK